MKKTFSFLLLIIFSLGFSQIYDSYTATNGIKYKLGDTLTLNIGSAPNGSFRYFQVGGFGKGFTHSNDNNNPTRLFTGTKIFIKKINKDKNERITFVVSAKRGVPYDLHIEEAIQTCEIKDCDKLKIESKNTHQPDKYDKLKKLQELKDAGTINSEEFESEKGKILRE